MAINQLLLEAGLDPCILPDPNKAAGLSREQFAEEILKAQLVHRCMTRAPEIDMPAFVASQLEWLRAQEGLRFGQAIDRFIALIEADQTLTPQLRNDLLQGIAPMLAAHETEVHEALRQNVILEARAEGRHLAAVRRRPPRPVGGPAAGSSSHDEAQS